MCELVEFRPIPGAPGYSISAEGTVIGRRGRPLRTFIPPTRCGPSLNIDLNGQRRIHPIKSLLELAWPEKVKAAPRDLGFRPIPGLDGYEINRDGQVCSFLRHTPKRLKIHVGRRGGRSVDVSCEGVIRRVNLDQLLYLAWPDEFPSPSVSKKEDPAPEPAPDEKPLGLDMAAIRRRIERLEAIVSGEQRRSA